MSGNRIVWTEERRRAHGQLSRARKLAKRAERREQERTRPAHVDRWLAAGVVATALRPIVKFRARQRAQMVEDLGGDLTAMQLAALDGWFTAQVAADGLAMVVLGEGGLLDGKIGRAPDRLPTYLNTARAYLQTLGLDRRARDVLDLQTIIAEHDAEGGSGPTKSNGRESSVVVEGEVAASEETSS